MVVWVDIFVKFGYFMDYGICFSFFLSRTHRVSNTSEVVYHHLPLIVGLIGGVSVTDSLENVVLIQTKLLRRNGAFILSTYFVFLIFLLQGHDLMLIKDEIELC